eukprot:6194496-Pleurochrysis_carterae.AAC.1
MPSSHNARKPLENTCHDAQNASRDLEECEMKGRGIEGQRQPIAEVGAPQAAWPARYACHPIEQTIGYTRGEALMKASKKHELREALSIWNTRSAKERPLQDIIENG